MTSTLHKDVARLTKQLGLPDKFYDQLLREDDWSFVIKLNALFEGACTHVLSTRLHTPELIDAFAHLDLANTKVGKIVLLRSLDVITVEQESFLRSLAELRNKLVHNISNVRFTFQAYLVTLAPSQLKVFTKNFGYGLNETIEIAEKKVSKAQFVRENPKLSLWLTASEILACLYLEFEVAVLRIKRLELLEYEALIREANA